MEIKKIFDDAAESVQSSVNAVGGKYESHIREKAIERVNQKIEERGLSVDDIESQDYETMVSDISKEIKLDYAKMTSKGLLAVIGLDLLFGL